MTEKIYNGLRLMKSILSDEPSYMVLFITAVCNARCEFCFYWEEIESAKSKLELTPEEYQKISLHLNHLYYLSIGGGEPFIRRDIFQIIEMFYTNSNTRTVAIASHGGFPNRTKEFLSFIQQKCPSLKVKIQLSLDNLYEKHDQSRKVEGLFDNLLKSCSVITEMKNKGANVMLTIGTVLTPENRNDIKAIKDFLDKNVSYDDLSLIYPRGNAKDQNLLKVSISEYRAAKKIFEATTQPVNFYTKLYREIDKEGKLGVEQYLEKGEKGYPWICAAGQKMVTLFERGNVTPCEMLPQMNLKENTNIGNVRNFNYDIPYMLRSEKGSAIRNFIVDTHCSCSYECAALCNAALNKRSWPKILKNTIFST
ncbi:MAG: radical SAM protein [Deltaproteobacteria bacterium]